jgi:dTMP kinase
MLRGLLLSGELDWSLPTETLLHFAARAEHVERAIRPALAAGTWVVCDRFADSTMAYQGHAQGGDRAAIASLTEMMRLRPDLTLVLDLDVAAAMARLHARGAPADRYERLGEGFFARVREGFRAIAAADPARCLLIPADRPEADVADAVWQAVRTRSGLPA